ncbi:UNVERIFIED_CONTAM: hypothetical protein Slati_1753600 [Sesamum latifolium]|uniref:Ty3 transposon capsid-like protein domain-containing protein n=1 Tax=Sesamum latifolium TaxID=2727402 RepID=A0AAW2WWW4_9LAMI
MSSLETSSQHNNHMGASGDGVIALPLKFSLKLGAKQETQVAEKDLFDDNMIHSSSTSSKAEIATVMMVQTTLLKEQIASLTGVVENLLKHVQARDNQLNKLYEKFQSTPTLNEFEEQDLSIARNTNKGIPVSTNGFVSIEHVKNTVNEAIAKIYETRVQVFKSYIKPYTKRIERLRMPENYQPPKFQQFNGHGDSRQHIAHFVETCNNAGTDGDLLTKQFVLSLKDAAFDWYIDLEHQGKDEPVLDYINNWINLSLNCKDTLSEISAIELCIQDIHWELYYILQAIRPKSFGELATRAHEIEMSFNCKEDEYLVYVNDDGDDDDDDATP